MTACTAPASAVTPASVRKDIEANLPIGSSATEVIAFLNERRWTDRARIEEGDVRPAYQNPDALELPAIIRNTRKVWPVSYSITMMFTFDKQRRLTQVKVEEAGTGP